MIWILAISVGCIEEQEPAPIIHIGLAEDTASAIASCDMSTKGEGTSICYVHVAQELEDESLCALIDDEPYRERCIWGVARVVQDPTLCKKISRPIINNLCIAIANNDRSSCSSFKGEGERITCIRWTDKG